jgi:hypothetical protein
LSIERANPAISYVMAVAAARAGARAFARNPRALLKTEAHSVKTEAHSI